jgi:glycosyltransferase involved in cell wall biosynthesis
MAVKIGIYNEPSGSSIGGCEASVAVLAEALSDDHDVSIIHHRKCLTIETLADFSRTNLANVRLQYVQDVPYSFGTSHNISRRYREARRWGAELSQGYDLFINFTHHVPPFCYAGKGVLVILFPFDELPYQQSQENSSSLAAFFKRSYHKWEWKKRMDSYQQRVSNSQFTREWTTLRWAIDSEVIYSPVDTEFRSVDKNQMILSVGRFATEGHSKNQLNMMFAFRDLVRNELKGWTYSCVGGLGGSSKDREYFEQVLSLGRKCGANTRANVPQRCVKELYEKATIFWHAAGYEMKEHEPELQEHFGKATVEAMAAGCIPVVFRGGGPMEVVEHGVNGFLWNTLDELKAYTAIIGRDETLRNRLSVAARARAQLFDRSIYEKRFRRLLGL